MSVAMAVPELLGVVPGAASAAMAASIWSMKQVESAQFELETALEGAVVVEPTSSRCVLNSSKVLTQPVNPAHNSDKSRNEQRTSTCGR